MPCRAEEELVGGLTQSTIQALIRGVWLCAGCVAARTGLSRIDAYESLNALAAANREFRTDVRCCEGCRLEQVVHRLG